MTGKELKEILRKYGFNNSQFAELVGVDKSTIGKYLKGDLAISDSRAKLINLALEDLSMWPVEQRSISAPINLKAFRKQCRVKQSEITELLGKSQPWISQVENGQGFLTREEEDKIIDRWPEADRFRGAGRGGVGKQEAETATLIDSLRDHLEMNKKYIARLEKDLDNYELTIKVLRENAEFQRKGAEEQNGGDQAG